MRSPRFKVSRSAPEVREVEDQAAIGMIVKLFIALAPRSRARVASALKTAAAVEAGKFDIKTPDTFMSDDNKTTPLDARDPATRPPTWPDGDPAPYPGGHDGGRTPEFDSV